MQTEKRRTNTKEWKTEWKSVCACGPAFVNFSSIFSVTFRIYYVCSLLHRCNPPPRAHKSSGKLKRRKNNANNNNSSHWTLNNGKQWRRKKTPSTKRRAPVSTSNNARSTEFHPIFLKRKHLSFLWIHLFRNFFFCFSRLAFFSLLSILSGCAFSSFLFMPLLFLHCCSLLLGKNKNFIFVFFFVRLSAVQRIQSEIESNTRKIF